MTQYVPMIVVALGVAMIYAIFKSKTKGTDIIDAIRDRKVVLQEALLVFLAILEGLIAADVAFSENMNYWVRLSAHMAIAAISVIFGSTLYRQFQELYASIKLKQSFWMVFKELTDVFHKYLSALCANGADAGCRHSTGGFVRLLVCFSVFSRFFGFANWIPAVGYGAVGCAHPPGRGSRGCGKAAEPYTYAPFIVRNNPGILFPAEGFHCNGR